MLRNILIFASLFISLNGQAHVMHVPSNYAAEQEHPLVVVLHGCLQTGRDMATVTRFNSIADQNGFLVLYPEQNRQSNFTLCWNWFDPAHQGRSGEPELIVGLIERAKAEYNIDSSQIFIVGFSAGGSMASNLLSCYPEVFKSAAIHSGTNYKAARSAMEAFTAMRMGSQTDIESSAQQAFQCSNSQQRDPKSIFVLHGQRDHIVSSNFRSQVFEQFDALNDLFDDGQRNSSFEFQSVREERLRSARGYNYVQTEWQADGARAITVDVAEMAHAWSGGQPGAYSDARGPDASTMIWEFFSSLD